jgi:hypothetical protein
MGTKAVVGDKVFISGGKHVGRYAVVTGVTPKLLEIQFLCTLQTSRVMAYNATLVQGKLNFEVPVMNDFVKVQKSPTTIADDTLRARIIEEINNINQSMQQLSMLLQQVQL